MTLHLLVLKLRLELLHLDDLAHGLHEILIHDVIALGPDRKHARFRANIAQISAVEAIRQLCDRLVVDLAGLGNGSRVDLEDVQAGLLVRQRDLDLAVQTARPQQRRVQHVRPIRRHDDLDLAQHIEAVHLVQQLHQRTLDLAVGRGTFREAAAADGVNLVHEDDARLVVARVAEHLADHAGALADVLVDDRTRDHFQEVCINVRRDGTGKQSLSGAGRAVEQAALGRLDADTLEQLRIPQRQLNDFTQLANLLCETTDFVVGHVAGVLVRHVVDKRVDLAGERAHDGERGHVQRNASARLELCAVDTAAAAHNVARPARSFDNKFLLSELAQNLANHLAYALQSLQVILALVVRLLKLLSLLTDALEVGLKSAVLLQLLLELGQRL
eukprot:m.225234 g.225234  ORF g.225234 m.225234 type:complete len:387 (+) comp11232_c0_seq1:43-1203(+)